MRAEATEAVAQAREMTLSAVSEMRISQAKESMMEVELRNLRAQVEALREENHGLRTFQSRTLESDANHEASNGSEWGQRVVEIENHIVNSITPRLVQLEEMMGVTRNVDSCYNNWVVPQLKNLEAKFTELQHKIESHQRFIQELWYDCNPREPEEALEIPNLGAGQVVNTPTNHFRIHEDDGDGSDGGTHGGGSDAGNDVEKRALRVKELRHLKLPSLPESAAQYRTWRNAVRTAIVAFDQSYEGYLAPWLSEAFNARGADSLKLAQDSGPFPRFDPIIASLLCRQETLKTSFGLKVQSYVESCENSGQNIRGRFILNLIASEYDTTHASTSITTSIELFQLPAPHDTVAGLKLWHDKVTYILSQIPMQQRPQDDMLSQWAYGSLKKHHLMRRVVDRYLEVPAFRTFDYLWQGVETVLKESQYDTNAQSIRDDLRKGPTSLTKKVDAKAMPAQNSKGKGSGSNASMPKASVLGDRHALTHMHLLQRRRPSRPRWLCCWGQRWWPPLQQWAGTTLSLLGIRAPGKILVALKLS